MSINFSKRYIFWDILNFMSHFLYFTLYSTNYNFPHTPFSFPYKITKFKNIKKNLDT